MYFVVSMSITYYGFLKVKVISKSNNYLRLGAGVKADVCLYVPETALHIEIVDF